LSFGNGNFLGIRVAASAYALVVRIAGQVAVAVAAATATEPKKLLRDRVFITTST
jgi:hypothetical protein